MMMLMKLQEQGYEGLSAYEWVEGSGEVIDVLESWGVESAEVDDLLYNLGDHAIDSLYFYPPFPPFVWGTSRGTVTISFCEE